MSETKQFMWALKKEDGTLLKKIKRVALFHTKQDAITEAWWYEDADDKAVKVEVTIKEVKP